MRRLRVVIRERKNGDGVERSLRPRGSVAPQPECDAGDGDNRRDHSGDQWRAPRGRYLNGRAIPGDRCDESISTPRQRLDESRILGGVVEGLTKFSNRRIEAVIEVDEFRGPQTLPNFLAGHDVAGSLEKQGQKTEAL